ncbi:hypothetical protein BD410DRAFT_810746, partial [Rickenella mellea]
GYVALHVGDVSHKDKKKDGMVFRTRPEANAPNGKRCVLRHKMHKGHLAYVKNLSGVNQVLVTTDMGHRELHVDLDEVILLNGYTLAGSNRGTPEFFQSLRERHLIDEPAPPPRAPTPLPEVYEVDDDEESAWNPTAAPLRETAKWLFHPNVAAVMRSYYIFLIFRHSVTFENGDNDNRSGHTISMGESHEGRGTHVSFQWRGKRGARTQDIDLQYLERVEAVKGKLGVVMRGEHIGKVVEVLKFTNKEEAKVYEKGKDKKEAWIELRENLCKVEARM